MGRLQIMLQRRKKYKNRTILGYKTLAEGVIRMDQVLQRSMDMELELIGVGGKGGVAAGSPIARLNITGLASTPVDHDTKNNNTLLINERGYSDEEEEGEFSSVEEAEEMTYGAPQSRRRTHRQLGFNKADLSYTKQRNLKQKFAALLRRFRVPDEMGERGAARDTHHAQRDIDELFQELESLSCGEGEDSGPDQMDTISIGSTPKPSLRPFFSSSRSLANPDHHRHSNESETARAGEERGSEGNSDGDAANEAPVSGASVSSSPPKDTKEEKRSRLFRSAAGATARKKNSLVVCERPLSAHELPAQSPTALEPRRTVLEQVSRVLGEEGAVPETVALVGSAGGGASAWAAVLAALALPVVTLPPPHDARPLLQALLARLNKQTGGRRGVRLLVCGGDALVAGVVRAHVELAARRVPDLPPPRYYIVPAAGSAVARQLAASDAGYAALFAGDAWAALLERPDSPLERQELCARVARYLNSVGPVMNVPIGEAMVACREKGGDEDSSQIFVPFIAEVRLGCSEAGASSLELEEGGSPPARPSPPATPAPAPADAAPRLEPLELQLDYWLSGRGAEGGDKVTVKAAFRALLVARHHTHLSLAYITKEKKQKIMRLGKKKEKAGEADQGRAQVVDGIHRLICSAKTSHNQPLKVYIDGTEWNGVKFFQLSTQWQTHVKTFPVATSGAPLAPPET